MSGMVGGGVMAPCGVDKGLLVGNFCGNVA